jgi:hypothetical protein
LKKAKAKKSTSSRSPAQCSYDSIAAAAAALGIATAVLKKAKRSGAPGFRGSRVYPAELLPWLSAQEPAPVNPDQVKEEIAREMLRERKFRNEEREGRFLPKAETLAAVRDLAELLKSKLRSALEDDLPPLICNQPPAIIRTHMKELVDRLCREFQEAMGKL